MFKLIYNEWIKIFSRVGTWAMIVILGVSMIGFALLSNHFTSSEANPNWKQELQAENKEMKQQMKETGNQTLIDNLKQNVAINQYRMDHNIPEDTGYTVWSYVTDSSMMTVLTGLFTIIIAAGIVANEFNWGTIKALAIRPLSRFQILLSKYMTMLAVRTADACDFICRLRSVGIGLFRYRGRYCG